MSDTMWAYGRADGEDMGDYSHMVASDRDEAMVLAGDFASDHHGYGEDAPAMVVYEVRPVLVGTPVFTPGEDLGYGDKEPDEFEWLDWADVSAKEEE